MSLSYPSDLSLDEFELIQAFCPEAKSGGRPRTTDLWAILNAIFYLVAEGCRWRSIPMTSLNGRPFTAISEPGKEMALGSEFRMPCTIALG